LGEYFTEISDSSVRAQAGPTSWIADYPSSINNVHTDVVSERLRNDHYHPQWGLIQASRAPPSDHRSPTATRSVP
jgi:hypothetical protein